MANGDLSNYAQQTRPQQPGWGDVTAIGPDPASGGGTGGGDTGGGDSGWSGGGAWASPLGQGAPYQRFFNPVTNRGPSGWGQPDYVLQGARDYPAGALPEGSGMPAARDVPGLVNQIGRGFANYGSQGAGLMGVGMMKAYGAYQKAFAEGQLKRAQIDRERYVMAATQLEDTQRKEMAEYAQIRAEYADRPEEMQHRLLAQAQIFHDHHAINALSQGPGVGLKTFDRLIDARDENFQSLEKVNAMRARKQAAELAQRREQREAAASEERLRIERERLRMQEQKARLGTPKEQQQNEIRRIQGLPPLTPGATAGTDTGEEDVATPPETSEPESAAPETVPPDTGDTDTGDTESALPWVHNAPGAGDAQGAEPANPQTAPGAGAAPTAAGETGAQGAIGAPGQPGASGEQTTTGGDEPATFDQRFGGPSPPPRAAAEPPAGAGPETPSSDVLQPAPTPPPSGPAAVPSAVAAAAPTATTPPPAAGYVDQLTQRLRLPPAAADRFKARGWNQLQGLTVPGTDPISNAYVTQYATDLQRDLERVAADPNLKTRHDVIGALRRVYAPAGDLVDQMLNYDTQGYAGSAQGSTRGLAWRNLSTALAKKADPNWNPRQYHNLGVFETQFNSPNGFTQRALQSANRMGMVTTRLMSEINALEAKGLLTGQRFTNAINKIWTTGVTGDPDFVGLQSALFGWQQEVQRVEGGGVSRVGITAKLGEYASAINSPAQLREVIKNGNAAILGQIKSYDEFYQQMFKGQHKDTPGYLPGTVKTFEALEHLNPITGKIELPDDQIPVGLKGVARGAAGVIGGGVTWKKEEPTPAASAGGLPPGVTYEKIE